MSSSPATPPLERAKVLVFIVAYNAERTIQNVLRLARHFIVNVPIVTGNQFYDPSYGVTYPSEVGFESQAVAGYAFEFPGDVGTGRNHVFTPVPGQPNISFLINPYNSM